MTDIDAIARELLQEHHKFKYTCKTAYLAARDNVWSLYENWRDSESGKQWKAQFLQQCENRCPECCNWLTPYNTTIDHKLPRSKYPWLGWEVSNLWILCHSCNKAKSDQEWSEYVNSVYQKRGKAARDRVIKYSSL
jgi:5-methylcytosine-specific restriction endonuclease McrA